MTDREIITKHLDWAKHEVARLRAEASELTHRAEGIEEAATALRGTIARLDREKAKP